MDIQLHTGYAVYGNTSIINGSTLFAFDLDHTIIKPQSGKFCKTALDWEFVQGMEISVREISKHYPVAIFTNQGGVSAGKVSISEVIARIGTVVQMLSDNIIVFIGLSPRYCKPSPKLYEKLIYGYAPEITRGFYIGDASDNDVDFSDTDYRFAKNVGLEYIPVEVFRTIPMTVDYIARLSAVAVRRELPRVNVRGYIVADGQLTVPTMHPRVLAILVGPPGCGKSTYAKTLSGDGWRVVSRDALRQPTAVQALRAVKAAIPKEGPVHIIIDATHPDAKSREAYLTLAKAQNMKTCAVVFDVPIAVAKQMNRARCISGGNYVPEIAYGAFLKRYQAPTVGGNESFDEVITINSIPLRANSDQYLDLYF